MCLREKFCEYMNLRERERDRVGEGGTKNGRRRKGEWERTASCGSS
jgi:hypothetical protein